MLIFSRLLHAAGMRQGKCYAMSGTMHHAMSGTKLGHAATRRIGAKDLALTLLEVPAPT